MPIPRFWSGSLTGADLQPGSLTGTNLSANLQLERPITPLAVSTAAGPYEAGIIMGKAGTIGGFRLSFLQALAASDVNFISFAVNNKTQAKSMTADNTGGRNTTKVTGGVAIAQYTPGYPLVISLTPANMVVASGDFIVITATVTGTLANAVNGSFSAALVPT